MLICVKLFLIQEKNIIEYNYIIGNKSVPRIELLKALGVWFDSKLTFNITSNFLKIINFHCAKLQKQRCKQLL